MAPVNLLAVMQYAMDETGLVAVPSKCHFRGEVQMGGGVG